jgi:tRNA modification GTPase
VNHATPEPTPDTNALRVTVTTANAPGAVALIQLHGSGTRNALQQLTGVHDFSLSRVKLVDFLGVDHISIDQGIAVLLRDDWAQLQPHGSTRIVSLLLEHLRSLGAIIDDPHATTSYGNLDARSLYPEARSRLEAHALRAIAHASSPAAIPLLLSQTTELWSKWLRIHERHKDLKVAAIILLLRSATLQRLIDPPTVAVVGRPNVGKSTLSNRVLGSGASLVADEPGTTRDWVGGLAEHQGISLRWLDTPGLRSTSDDIEQRAIELAGPIVAAADIVIALRSPDLDWPDASALRREPDLWCINQCDRLPDAAPLKSKVGSRAKPLRISGKTGQGVDTMLTRVTALLGLDDAISQPTPWAFDAALQRIVRSHDWEELRRWIV